LSLEKSTRPSSVVTSKAPLLRATADSVRHAPPRPQRAAREKTAGSRLLRCAALRRRAPRVNALHVALNLHVRELILRVLKP
jgi:hypothetical protein